MDRTQVRTRRAQLDIIGFEKLEERFTQVKSTFDLREEPTHSPSLCSVTEMFSSRERSWSRDKAKERVDSRANLFQSTSSLVNEGIGTCLENL